MRRRPELARSPRRHSAKLQRAATGVPAPLWLLSVSSAAAAQAESSAARSGSGDLIDTLSELMGGWMRVEAFAGVSYGLLLLSAVVIVGVALAVQLLLRLLRRLARREDAESARILAEGLRGVEWLKVAVGALIPPLTLLLWAWGVYAALLLSITLAQGGGAPSFLRVAIDEVRIACEITALFWFLLRLIRVVEVELRRWATHKGSAWIDVLVAVGMRALRLIVPLLGALMAVSALSVPQWAAQPLERLVELLLIGAIGFILVQLINTFEEARLGELVPDAKDDLEARTVKTRVKVFRKVAVAFILLITAGAMLMTFDSMRTMGTSVLASAGVLGVIVGFAAQKTLSLILAGLQIAFTQPIRLGDVVIVEREWGRIEEIRLTYVVVRIWDLRRLILPINYFIEKPFENWTRRKADLLCSVVLYFDYTVPLKALRGELDRVLDESSLWDRRLKNIQVTDSKPEGIEVRVLVSAADSDTGWDLRCELREKLIDFMQRNYPESLPRMRAELASAKSYEGQASPLSAQPAK